MVMPSMGIFKKLLKKAPNLFQHTQFPNIVLEAAGV